MFGGGGSSTNKKTHFVKNAQQERELRQQKKKETSAVIKIQSWVRMFISRRKFCNKIRNDFDNFFQKDTDLYSAVAMFSQAKLLMLVYQNEVDDDRFASLCKSILYNMEFGKEPKYWYMSVMLLRDSTATWIKNIKHILNVTASKLRTCKIYTNATNKPSSLYLSMLVVFTDSTNWKILQMKGGDNIRPIMQQLCVSIVSDLVSKGLIVSLQSFLMNGLCKMNIALTQATLFAATTIIIRGLRSLDLLSAVSIFVINILTVPGYVYHLSSVSKDCLALLEENRFYERTVEYLCEYENMSRIYKDFDADESIALVGNIINLCLNEIQKFSPMKKSIKMIISGLLKHCKSFLGKHASNSKFHPILGWYHQVNHKRATNDASVHVLAQLRYLWQKPLVSLFFEALPSVEDSEATNTASSGGSESKGGLLRRAFLKTFRKTSSENVNVNEPVVADICSSCDLFRILANTLTQYKLEIFAGLGFQQVILVQLWRFIYSLGVPSVLKSILDYFSGESQVLGRPISSLLILFCDCSSQLIPILDDDEIYEKQKPFTCKDLVKMSGFLNSLVFKLIWLKFESTPDKEDDTLKKGSLELLSILYDRDCRRSFTPPDHWLIKELRMNQFLLELKDKENRAQSLLDSVPHVIPHMERVKIFYNWVNQDRKNLGIDRENSRPSAFVSIHRNRLLEDGYEQLTRYMGTQLKGIIRVEFVNEQGLEEAGIDQHGVFKEFLEDVIKEAFNPQLNLFKMTTGTQEQKLYPSPTSFIHSNHMNLFEFVGKMLGKAVYEGILVDVPFATFFLNSILQHHRSAMYSSIDELPSLDPEMYKHLNFIKNYEGDVSDLQLVFAYNEDVLGQMVTHDLKPGGRAINVTNSNKFMYIHMMAQFRIHTQIRDVSTAFISGFCSIISPQWLRIFSPGELQHLISGDSGRLDLSDLRSHTRYFGGYHSNHPVVLWLWDILNNDFTHTEKKLFLKFVTSCSNPPLMGFKYLEPQFSIRFVDCTEDEDEGDSVGSVVRGLLNVRKAGSSSGARLPTSSTCFNLLKLPGYKKKSVLREKLRYAINSGAGFELS